MHLCKQLHADLKGTYIQKITQINTTDFLFSLTDKKKSRLLFSLNHQAPFLSAGKDDSLYSTKVTPFYLSFRKELSDMRLLSIESMQNDRIVRLTFRGTNETFHTIHRYVFFEAIPNRANLILTDENMQILLVFYPTSLTSTRILERGFPYSLPASKEEDSLSIFSKVEKEKIIEIAQEKKQSVEEIKEQILQEGVLYHEENQWSVLPLSSNAKKATYFDLFDFYNDTMKLRRREDLHRDVVKLIEQKIRISERKIKKIEGDIQQAESHLQDREIGDLLLTYGDEISIQGEQAEWQGMTFSYQPLQSVYQNANIYYKQYQKAKKAIQILQEQKEQTQLEIDYFHTLKTQISHANDEDFACMEEELQTLHLKQNTQSKKKPIKEEATRPYYIEVDGFRIAFGKNNLQNNRLTFSIAQKDDYFFHVADFPGSHVVILSSNPSQNAIQTAAEIALYFSGLESGDVRICDKKDVKKLGKPGLVSLKTYQTIHLNHIRKETIGRLNSAKRLSR